MQLKIDFINQYDPKKTSGVHGTKFPLKTLIVFKKPFS